MGSDVCKIDDKVGVSLNRGTRSFGWFSSKAVRPGKERLDPDGLVDGTVRCLDWGMLKEVEEA